MKIEVRVGPSRIAGQGLFAIRDMHKGTRIMQYIGEKISSRERARRLAAAVSAASLAREASSGSLTALKVILRVKSAVNCSVPSIASTAASLSAL